MSKVSKGRSPRRKFKLKASPKKKQEVFNPFGLDLSSNVDKILGFDTTKNKGYEPGRKYAIKATSHRIYKNQEVLNHLEQDTNMKKQLHQFQTTQYMKKIVSHTEDQVKYIKKYNSKRIYQKAPLRRGEQDVLLFKDVFVVPRQIKLQALNKKRFDNEDDDKKEEELDPQFKRLIKYQKDPNEIKIKKRRISKNKGKGKGQKPHEIKSLLTSQSSYQDREEKEPQKKSIMSDLLGPKVIKEKPQEEEKTSITGKKPEKSFFESQILVQPTEMPNATIASPLTPGNGWAPSLPLLNLKNTNKESVKDLLIRANAGMQAGDIQKEAHLTFYLGVIHEANKSYSQAIKFHKKFYSCAKLMEDKVGMALAMNRIGINLFNSNKKKRSIEYHLKNVEFTDQENAFAGLYNLGISYRAVGDYLKSIEYFQKALDWAQDRKEIESECLSFGQLGMTHLRQLHHEISFDYFQKCLSQAKYMRNTRLELDCLMYMSKIVNITQENHPEKSLQVLKDTFKTAADLGDMKTVNICVCNIGIIEGKLGIVDHLEFVKKILSEKR